MHVTKSITLYEGFCECDLRVIKLVTKCKHANVLIFIQSTKKINHNKSQFLKTAKVYSHLLIGESRTSGRTEWKKLPIEGEQNT